ncbi:MAG: septal ring lytic transglycosylase RlpA family protein [Pseudomonadota bacterium]
MKSGRIGLCLTLACAVILMVGGCVTPPEPAPAPPPPTTQQLDQGVATQAVWYGMMHQGRTTASGEQFDMRRLTASHASLPFGTRLEVFCPATARQVVVTVNDRSHLEADDGLALSAAAAQALGIADRRRSAVVYRLAK